MKKERAVLDRQRAEVLEMLCGPNPVSKKYKPAPATCAQWKNGRCVGTHQTRRFPTIEFCACKEELPSNKTPTLARAQRARVHKGGEGAT